MKYILSTVIGVMLLSACHDGAQLELLRHATDSLSKELIKMRPGLGEYMLSVQMHHNKLWYAGSNQNWDLADFEIDEVKEQFEHAKLVNTDRTEVRSLPMIEPFVDSLAEAIKNKDTARFRKQFVTLTATCNECHRSVHFDFIRIKVPDRPMFYNQEW